MSHWGRCWDSAGAGEQRQTAAWNEKDASKVKSVWSMTSKVTGKDAEFLLEQMLLFRPRTKMTRKSAHLLFSFDMRDLDQKR